MLARVRSAAVLGIEAYPVDVEVDLSNGLPSFTTVGLPHGAVKEGRERINAALVNSGFEFPLQRITANLAPADVRKDGSAFDLPIALGILAASGQLDPERLADGFVFGELGLEGAVRSVRGMLPMVACAERSGARWALVPAANQAEAAVLRGLAVYPAATLGEVVGHLNGTRPLRRGVPAASTELPAADDADFRDVSGQAGAKRALEIAAAGGHNVLLVGPPGAGKTMLARRLPSILPPLTLDEALEVTSIHSVAGLLSPGRSLLVRRPFRAPHHTISDAGLAGGGSPPRPGEISLAHRGVLFLDELPEFRRNVLEVLRQPLEDGVVTLARAAMSLAFPARFVLVAAMNPCPCGYHGDALRHCQCSPEAVARYRGRVSGPLYDRIDLQVVVPALRFSDQVDAVDAEPSGSIRARVEAARERQQRRLDRDGIAVLNADLTPKQLRQWCRLDASTDRLLAIAADRLGFSARATSRVLKLARTIADLDQRDRIESRDVGEAVQYRAFDRVFRARTQGPRPRGEPDPAPSPGPSSRPC
jgi:magnesium chelatase family protein